MSNAKQITAVRLFRSQMMSLTPVVDTETTYLMTLSFNQALEIEKEQALQTLKSFRHHLENGGDAENLEEWFEQHYNETFKQQNQ